MFFFKLFLEFGRAWDYCRNNGENGGYIYCKTDCCGSWPYEKCCEDRAWLGWAIAGGVIGGILLISLIVCVVCVCIKQKGKTGRIVQPQPGKVPICGSAFFKGKLCLRNLYINVKHVFNVLIMDLEDVSCLTATVA
jgi:hypothetical protein